VLSTGRLNLALRLSAQGTKPSVSIIAEWVFTTLWDGLLVSSGDIDSLEREILRTATRELNGKGERANFKLFALY
jgi:hypothetical protein